MKRGLVVLDWDGTVVDSKGTIVDCLARAAATLGLPARTSDELGHIIGLSLDVGTRQLFPDLDDDGVARYVAEYRRLWLDGGPPAPEVFDGAMEAIEVLAGRFTLAVATGKSRAGLERELDDLGLARHFAETRCGPETQSKPHPAMLLEILEVTEVPAREAWMVGDTTHDLQMAANAGVRSVGLRCGAHAEALLASQNPIAILDSLAQLPDYLEGRR